LRPEPAVPGYPSTRGGIALFVLRDVGNHIVADVVQQGRPAWDETTLAPATVESYRQIGQPTAAGSAAFLLLAR
jgi:hypothetical protein